MITYRFDEEKEYAIYYAEKMDSQLALQILQKDSVSDNKEAKALSEFFWHMVDASIQDEESGVELKWVEGAEYWNEKLMTSLSGYLERCGYEEIWDRVVDEQD